MYDEQEIEKMLRSMFFMAALHGSFLVSRGLWNWENRKRYEDACVKFLLDRQKLKQKGK